MKDFIERHADAFGDRLAVRTIPGRPPTLKLRSKDGTQDLRGGSLLLSAPQRRRAASCEAALCGLHTLRRQSFELFVPTTKPRCSHLSAQGLTGRMSGWTRGRRST